MMRANKQMQNYLLSLIVDANLAVVSKLSNKATELAISEIIADGSCFIFAKFADTKARVQKVNLHDDTGIECFVNHVHLNDYQEFANTADALLTGLQYTSLLHNNLRDAFSNTHFRTILIVSGREVHIRFHKVREGQDWLVADLDTYTDDAILELET